MPEEQKKPHKKDTQSRAYSICLHNIDETGFDHEKIKELLTSFPSLTYYCIADEIGCETKKLHTHVYFHCRNPVKFSTLKNKFEGSDLHIETSMGSAQANRDYIFKLGKWADDMKAEQKLPETQEEWGTLPVSRQGHRSDLEFLYSLICDGYTTAQILERNPNFILYLKHIEQVRQAIREEKYKDKWRDISCIYVFGETNTNKTRTYMEKFGYSNVYRITNYSGNAVWDGYRGQDVVIFEEYRSNLMIGEVLTWTEGYSNCSLRARYTDKIACYTKVIFISNIPLEEQYPNVQKESPATWRAFLRRIQKVIHHKSKTEIITYNSVEEYLHRYEHFQDIPKDIENPFDESDTNNPIEQQELPFD